MRLRHAGSAAALVATFVALALTPLASDAVNLVPNPGFEAYTNCPGGFGWLFEATPWDAPTQGTSDFLHDCASGAFAPDVPSNPVGFQFANGGLGMGGFIPYDPFNAGYREYLQSPLTSPMVVNQTYNVSFYVSLADNAQYAVDRVGAYFSVGAVGPIANWLPLPFVPQVETPAGTPIVDKTNWVLVSGSFVATAAYTHVIIGNFRDDASTTLAQLPGSYPSAYYYLDDIGVEAQPAQVDQACCLPDGQCVLLTPNECTSFGGVPLGVGVDCSQSPCDPTPAANTSWGAVKSTYR
jgi:hypothetical protein